LPGVRLTCKAGLRAVSSSTLNSQALYSLPVEFLPGERRLIQQAHQRHIDVIRVCQALRGHVHWTRLEDKAVVA
jgi:hypothetical protein